MDQTLLEEGGVGGAWPVWVKVSNNNRNLLDNSLNFGAKPIALSFSLEEETKFRESNHIISDDFGTLFKVATWLRCVLEKVG